LPSAEFGADPNAHREVDEELTRKRKEDDFESCVAFAGRMPAEKGAGSAYWVSRHEQFMYDALCTLAGVGKADGRARGNITVASRPCSVPWQGGRGAFRSLPRFAGERLTSMGGAMLTAGGLGGERYI
jgi:hypothetical protein